MERVTGTLDPLMVMKFYCKTRYTYKDNQKQTFIVDGAPGENFANSQQEIEVWQLTGDFTCLL